MNPRLASAMGGLGLGAGLMYVLDPARGARRRALARDKLARAIRRSRAAAGRTVRDLRNRARGIAARARSLGRRGRRGAGEPDRLAARVRSILGRAVSHPAAIHVSVRDGDVVTLEGPVLAHEVSRLIDLVAAAPGAGAVENKLEVHEDATGIKALQGGGIRAGERFELLQETWAPGPRLLVWIAGAGLLGLGVARRGLAGAALGAAGAALGLRAATNLRFGRIFGIGPGRAISVDETIRIEAPVEDVFAFFADPTELPKVMRHVRSVEEIEPGWHRWTVAGPAGVAVTFVTCVTHVDPEAEIAWETVPGSAVQHWGSAVLCEEQDGKTRVDVHLRYEPPAGAIGHGLAALLGADPGRVIAADLGRLRSLLETGVKPLDAAQPGEPRPAPSEPYELTGADVLGPESTASPPFTSAPTPAPGTPALPDGPLTSGGPPRSSSDGSPRP